EQVAVNHFVGGSNPSRGATYHNTESPIISVDALYMLKNVIYFSQPRCLMAKGNQNIDCSMFIILYIPFKI
ncbi:MAG: hypothetical protein ACE5EN_03375, partial [Nitrospinota bacterium]